MHITQKTLRITFIILFSILFFSCNNQDEKPNIVWLVTEDNSIHYMNLYTKGAAEMPAISALANQGVVFDNAFSNTTLKMYRSNHLVKIVSQVSDNLKINKLIHHWN